MGGLLRYGTLSRSSSRIFLADQITVNGQPESGNDRLDSTAVMGTQMTWDMGDRRFWPKNLTLWKRPVPWTNPDYEIGEMKYKGRTVLDYAGDPIRNFRIPLTISSKVEGLRIESWMRSDNRLTYQDIEAREWTRDAPEERSGKAPMFNRRALSKRTSNARNRAGLISWIPKKGREAYTAFMDNLRTPAQKAGNLTIGRMLTLQESAQYTLLGYNQEKVSTAPTRAGRLSKILRAASTAETAAPTSPEAASAVPVEAVVTAGGQDDILVDYDGSGDDAQEYEASQEPSSEDQAAEDDTSEADSFASSIIDPADSRHDQPADPQEEALLQSALENTVQEFNFLTGQEPVLTNLGDNYFSQWGMLQHQLASVWAANGNVDEAPRLAARNRWIGGISQYYLADEIEGSW